VTIFLKERLLERIEEAALQPNSWTLPALSTPSHELAEFSQQYGVHPSFLLVLVSVGGNDIAFWRQVVESLPYGANTRLLIARWIEWLWADPSVGLRRRIGDPDLRACGDSIFALQNRAAAGEEVSRTEWRAARGALSNAAAKVDAVQAGAAGGAAAAAWDLESVPGAAADMIYALKTTLFAEIDRDLAWNDEKEAAAAERSEKMHAAGLASAESEADQSATANGGTVDEAAQARMRELYQKGTQAFIAANPSDLDRRGELRNAAYAEIYRVAREGFLHQTSRHQGERSLAPVA